MKRCLVALLCLLLLPGIGMAEDAPVAGTMPSGDVLLSMPSDEGLVGVQAESPQAAAAAILETFMPGGVFGGENDTQALLTVFREVHDAGGSFVATAVPGDDETGSTVLLRSVPSGVVQGTLMMAQLADGAFYVRGATQAAGLAQESLTLDGAAYTISALHSTPGDGSIGLQLDFAVDPAALAGGEESDLLHEIGRLVDADGVAYAADAAVSNASMGAYFLTFTVPEGTDLDRLVFTLGGILPVMPE